MLRNQRFVAMLWALATQQTFMTLWLAQELSHPASKFVNHADYHVKFQNWSRDAKGVFQSGNLHPLQRLNRLSKKICHSWSLNGV